LATKNYELLFILNPDLKEEEETALLQRIKGYLGEVGGEAFHTESWGLRRLAYAIKHKKEGRYHLVRFAMEPSQIATFERNLLLMEGVLRELLTSFVPPSTKKSKRTPKMRNRPAPGAMSEDEFQEEYYDEDSED